MKRKPKGLTLIREPGHLGQAAREDYAILVRAIGPGWRLFRNEDGFPELICLRAQGRIFLWSKERVAVQVESGRRSGLTRVLASIKHACPSLQIEQRGDLEAIASVRLDEGRALAIHMRPWRVPQFSEEGLSAIKRNLQARPQIKGDNQID